MTVLSAQARSTCAAALAALALAGLPGMAVARSDAVSLDRGSKADVTPEQRYQSAIREAGGGLKIALAECKQSASAERKGCEAEARQRYKEDMEQARAMRKNPAVRPVDVQGDPIRSTETTTILRP